MSLVGDAHDLLGRSPLDKASATALVSIATSLEELVVLKRYELEAMLGVNPGDLFDQSHRPVVDTGPLPGGDE